MLSETQAQSCKAGYQSVTDQKCELSSLELGWETGIESHSKRSFTNLDRGRGPLSRLIRPSSVLTARKQHGVLLVHPWQLTVEFRLACTLPQSVRVPMCSSPFRSVLQGIRALSPRGVHTCLVRSLANVLNVPNSLCSFLALPNVA
jgi:hypothetical protein